MENYKYFIQDLVLLLKERLEEAKQNQTLPIDDFNKGLSMGIYECIDLIKQQAEVFNIPLEEVGLDNYKLEDFL